MGLGRPDPHDLDARGLARVHVVRGAPGPVAGPALVRIGSLFSGIGGLELGLEMAGLGHTVFQAEVDPYCLEVLAAHWPHAQRLRDVRDVNRDTVPGVDLICGGFPCQDLSVAGKGAGIEHGSRSGLWAEYARIVRDLRPRWVVVENVSRGRSRWVPRVCDDLEALGYHPAPVSISAAMVGAPHERGRTFVVADTHGQFVRVLEQREPARSPDGVPDQGQAQPMDPGHAGAPPRPSPWATLPALDGVGHGVPPGMDVGAARAARHRAIGNAVAPHVAEAIGRAILEAART